MQTYLRQVDAIGVEKVGGGEDARRDAGQARQAAHRQSQHDARDNDKVVGTRAALRRCASLTTLGEGGGCPRW